MHLIEFLKGLQPGDNESLQEAVEVEYRLACSGELYNRGVVTADWRKSDITRVLLSERRVELFVASRPFDDYPQELRYRQDLWMRLFQATSVSVDWQGSSGVMSTGRSSSFPLWNTAPARTRATRCGAFTARQRVCAASMSL